MAPFVDDAWSALVDLLQSPEAARQELEECQRLGIELDSATDGAGWPGVAPPPALLYRKGPRLLPSSRPRIAVVGSRNASPLGRRQAYRLGAELSESGCLVVSGLARGIDSFALEGAVASGCGAGAVLGNGLPGIYPQSSSALASRMLEAGGFLLTEYPLGAPPRRHHFPRRNRLISGLAQAVVVVEATLKSGSLITVDWALRQGREVLVFPGPVEGPHYEGCHRLLREGAHLVTCAEDVLEILAAGTASNSAPTPQDWEHILRLARDAENLESLQSQVGLPASLTLRAWAEAHAAEEAAKPSDD